MRRADRLFRIAQLLEEERPITARQMAEELEISVRTVYRLIDELTLSGVPIYGEPGVGYRIGKGFRLPPLMLDEEELSALILGVRMVRSWTDPALAQAAGRALAKVEATLPQRLLPALERMEMLVPERQLEEQLRGQLQLLREVIKAQRKIQFAYVRADGDPSERTIWPLGLFHWGKTWTLAGWSELRDDFRHFRVDRITALRALETHYPQQSGRTLRDYLITVCGEDHTRLVRP